MAAAAACVGLIAACKKPAPQARPPLELPVIKVIQLDTPITADRVGQIYGAEDIEIRARVAGFLEGMHFKEGSRVRKGDLLYTIDPREQQEEVARAQGDLASAKTRLVKAESDVSRYRPLAAMKAVAQADLDAAVAEEGAARGQVDAAEATLRFTKLNLGYTRITAPIDGLIGMTQAKVGDYVGQFPNPIVLNTLSNIDTVQARFSISERDYLDLVRKFKGSAETTPPPTNIRLLLADGSEYQHPGMLDFADRQVDPTTGTLRLQATFPNPERILRPGQYARVRVVVEERKGALLLPQRAVQELQGQQMVALVGADDTVTMKAVTMGPRIGSLWLVEKGLQPGDRVVLEGAQKVPPGAKVVPKEVPPPDPSAPAPAAGAASN
ncbi:MAG TPA: efflux RND transporter periplasmic adaptor subunit [Candidatus Polarisedimenticolia bacterium]|nr:efflux RND transporter periplasmic adaptor subunit [Candidatus Polarisedimenticolia bacterium]